MKKRNKFLSLFLAALMTLSLFPITNIKAEAASQSEAVNWATAQVGKSIDFDGYYGAQCVDLIQAYYAFLGEKSPSITAYKYSTVSLPSGWTRIKYYSGFVPQPGDIAVWTYTTSSNGHAAIVTSATSSRMYVVEQNGSTGKTRAHSYNYYYGTFYGVIRPKLTASSTNTTDTCTCSTSYAGEYITNPGSGYTLNIRSGHGTSYPIVSTIAHGIKVNITKSNGKWAHITYNGVSGYVSMDYLEKVESITVNCSESTLNLVIGATDNETVKVWTEGTSSKKTRLTCSVNNNVVKCTLDGENAKITAQSVGTAKVTFSLIDDETGKPLNSTVLTVNVTEKTKTYTVVYNANGGNGTMSNSTHTYNVAKNLNANTFTRNGYAFLGWSQSASATTATYTDKQSVKNLTSTDGATVTLYAVWQKITTPPATGFIFSILEPTIIEIRNKDGIILHTEVLGKLPDGAKIEWSWDNDNFIVEENEDGTITIIADENGNTIFTATVYDSKGKVLSSDTVEMNSKSDFFNKIGGFFRSLFGSTTIYEK